MSRHWHTLIHTRRHLRSRCFLQAPTAPPLRPLSEWTLHPALQMVDYWEYCFHAAAGAAGAAEGGGLRTRLRGRSLVGTPVASAMACMPAVARVGVWIAGSIRWIQAEMGVTVWALFEGLGSLYFPPFIHPFRAERADGRP